MITEELNSAIRRAITETVNRDETTGPDRLAHIVELIRRTESGEFELYSVVSAFLIRIHAICGEAAALAGLSGPAEFWAEVAAQDAAADPPLPEA